MASAFVQHIAHQAGINYDTADQMLLAGWILTKGSGDPIKWVREEDFAQSRPRIRNSYQQFAGDRQQMDNFRKKQQSRLLNQDVRLPEFIFESIKDANKVREELVRMTQEHGWVTLADLKDLVGVAPDFVDRRYGWRRPGTATISQVREGYRLDLPALVLDEC